MKSRLLLIFGLVSAWDEYFDFEYGETNEIEHQRVIPFRTGK